MKTITVLLCAVFWSAGCLAAEPIEFSGYLKMSGEPQFILTDIASGKSSGWLKTGQSFHGYTVSAFDPKTEALSVTKAKDVMRLPLKLSKVADRTASLAKILEEQETRLAAGQGDQEGVFLSRVALYSSRSDSSPLLADKIRNQELVVSTQTEREAFWKSRRATGVATEFDVLEKTEDLLRARVKLSELKATAK